jgi:hypothetical protein
MFALDAILNIGNTIIERVFPDPAAAAQAKLALFEMQQKGELTELTAQADIVKAEVQSESWLASSWRPILMLVFGGLIVARWFGWAAPNLSEAEYLKLWDIVQLGLGGYVIGRSAEKIVPSIADALGKK